MITNIFKRVLFWLDCSRAFALPMTVMSWLVVFVWGIKHSGCILNGILALLGIIFAHLATNLIDDYCDYKILCQDEKYIKTAQKCKCAHIFEGRVTLPEMLRMIILYCLLAAIIGLILTFKAGLPVIWLALIGAGVTLFYQKCSLVGLSEFAVFVAYGPLMFEGVYFVMTKQFSFEVLLLSFAVVMFTLGFLYVHTMLDFDGDMTSHKRTLCCRIGDKNKAIKLLAVFYTFGYLASAILSYYSKNLFLLITFLTVPLAIITYNETKIFEKNRIPVVKWWNLPFENQEFYMKEGSFGFYFTLFQARNLMTEFCILMSIAIFLP